MIFIPRNGQKSKYYLVKRHGAESAHSGYVYKDSGCLYLFTTGTIYPNEKLISPFIAYAYKYHNGNHSEARKRFIRARFWQSIKRKIKEIEQKYQRK